MTPASELERWDTLLERQAEGEPLSADDRAFVASYAARNPDAAAELEILHGLGSALERAPRSEAPGDRELIARVFEQGRAAPRTTWRVTPLRSAAALGLVALVAGVALWWARPPSVLPAGEQAQRQPAVMRLSAPVTGVTIDGARATTGTAVRQGQRIETRDRAACFRFETRDGVRACLAPGSVARVASLNADLRLVLERGAVAAELEPQIAGTSFALQSGSVIVRAVGTRFGLEIASASLLNVLAGVVEVSGDGPTYRVSAPHRVELGTHRSAALDEPQRRAMEQLLEPSLNAAPPPIAPSAAAPVTATPELPAPGGATAAPPSSPSAGPPAASAGELLARARIERARGSMRDAARSYRYLINEYPSSAEALTARVALGQLELSSLGDASSALAHFNEYLRRGGPLEQEARYGQVRALAALSRSAEEKQAIAAFLAKYPKALQAAALQERLKALGSATLKK